MEYGYLAKYYDFFYKNKNYENERNFLLSLIKSKQTILDAGCGTGEHLKLLENLGYQVEGFDLSKEMLSIAKTKTKSNLYEGNIKTFNNGKKYDAIISMFAVFNHLNDYEEFEIAIKNLLGLLKKDGILIIDLHNGRKSGQKEDVIANLTRIMKWEFDFEKWQEHTEIKYLVDGKEYHDTHTFKIFEIDKIKDILNRNKLKYDLYENYSLNKANDNSKNIQVIIYKV